MSCGVGCRRGSDRTLLWLWCRLTATALIWPPSLGTSICRRCSPEKPKEKKKKRILLYKRKFEKEGRAATKLLPWWGGRDLLKAGQHFRGPWQVHKTCALFLSFLLIDFPFWPLSLPSGLNCQGGHTSWCSPLIPHTALVPNLVLASFLFLSSSTPEGVTGYCAQG